MEHLHIEPPPCCLELDSLPAPPCTRAFDLPCKQGRLLVSACQASTDGGSSGCASISIGEVNPESGTGVGFLEAPVRWPVLWFLTRPARLVRVSRFSGTRRSDGGRPGGEASTRRPSRPRTSVTAHPRNARAVPGPSHGGLLGSGSMKHAPAPERIGARLERVLHSDGAVAYRSPLLSSVGIPHLFTTRIAGADGELDLGALDPAARERLCAVAGAPGARLVCARQVHGACAVHVRS